MSIGTAIGTGFHKYFRHGGRARRAEFWWFYLTLQVGSFVLGLVIGLTALVAFPGAYQASGDHGLGLELITRLLGLAALVGVINASTRRLHDRGMSGWWNLLMITIIGIVPLIVIWCLDSSPRSNRYGPSPKQAVHPAV